MDLKGEIVLSVASCLFWILVDAVAGKVNDRLPSLFLLLLLGDSETFSGLMGHIIPPVCSGSVPWAPPSWMYPESLLSEAFRRHLDDMP